MKYAIKYVSMTACLLLASTLVFANDPGKEFSITKNPNGVWSYGYIPTLGGPFTLYSATKLNFYGVQGWDNWYSPEAGSCDTPYATRGIIGRETQQVANSLIVPRESVEMHPSCTNDYAVVRWTAPAAGKYELHGNFFGMQTACGGTSTDVHIRWNTDTSLFDGGVYGVGNGRFAFVDFEQQVTAGDTIDFAVGFGKDGNYWCDSTALDLRIDLVLAVDIKPTDPSNKIHVGTPGTIPIAILSDASFDAASMVVRNTLTFGRIGDEQSLIYKPDKYDTRLQNPVCSTPDVNGDGRKDLVCQFDKQLAGFQFTDTYGVLHGTTKPGITVKGTDAVIIVK
jgi:hypothetical protein